MSAAILPLPPQAAYTDEPIYRFSVEQYHELIHSGILTSDDPIELIEGVLVFKMPKNPPHEVALGLIQDLLTDLLPFGWHLRNQAPLTLSDGEPEPDATITRGLRRDYVARHPSPADVALVIEVADSTLARDSGLKLRSYARAGIVCYWIVNLIDREIEVFTDPDSTAETPEFRRGEVFRSGSAVPLLLDGNNFGPVQVSDVLPPIE